MKLDNRMFALGVLVGLVLIIASFAAYVSQPKTTYTLLFVIGLLLLVGGYAFTWLDNRRHRAGYFAAMEEQEKSGVFFISLDDDYVPYDNPATIEDLRDM